MDGKKYFIFFYQDLNQHLLKIYNRIYNRKTCHFFDPDFLFIFDATLSGKCK